jgi:solute carrier family 25 oxoglutarate transporter 11
MAKTTTLPAACVLLFFFANIFLLFFRLGDFLALLPSTETVVQIAIAAAAGVGATCCVHPLDVVRINLQVDARAGRKSAFQGSMLKCFRSVAEKGGLAALYAGLGAGILRQLTYGVPRMTLYPMLVDLVRDATAGETAGTLPLLKKFVCGAAAGGLASLLGVPSETCMVRMAADGRLPHGDPRRRGYTSVLDALSRIVWDEGFMALWSGAGPTVARAILLNAGQLAVYSEAKRQASEALGLAGVSLQFVSALISATVAVALCCPADVLKSRMKNATKGHYDGVFDCARRLVAQEGPGALWKGYGPATIKLAPHTVISFFILDGLYKTVLGREGL